MPTSSCTASGPTGMPIMRAAFSISAGVMPSPTMVTPSLTKLPKNRLVKKPRASLTTIGVLRSRATRSSARARVASEVLRPRITSTKGIRSTGEKKCSPMKSLGRFASSASPVIGSVEVFEASTASLPSTASTAAMTPALMARSSNTASITSWASRSAA